MSLRGPRTLFNVGLMITSPHMELHTLEFNVYFSRGMATTRDISQHT